MATTKKKAAAPKKAASKAVATNENASLPSWVGDYKGEWGNTAIDSDLLVIPNVKLLQGGSEIMNDPELRREVSVGDFFHTIANKSLGDTIEVSVLAPPRTRYILRAPRHDQNYQGNILARSDDGKNWSPSVGEFKVQPYKGSKETVTWKLAPRVKASGLAEFGSFDPSNPDSNPAATRIIEFVVFIHSAPELSPAVLQFSGTSVKIAKRWATMLSMQDVPIFGQKYLVSSQSQQATVDGDSYTFQQFSFKPNGYLPDPSDYKLTPKVQSLAEHFMKVNDWRGNEDGDPDDNSGGSPAVVIGEGDDESDNIKY